MGFIDLCHHFFFETSPSTQDRKQNNHFNNLDEPNDNLYNSVIVSKPKEILQLLQDPITLEIFVKPGILECGHTIEKESFELLKKSAASTNVLCPICQQKTSIWIPNYSLQQMCNLIQNK